MQVPETTEKDADRANDALAQRKQWRQTLQQTFREGHRKLLQQQLEFFKIDDPAYQRLVQRVQQLQEKLEKDLEELCQNHDGPPREEQRPGQRPTQPLAQRTVQLPEQKFRRRDKMMRRSAAFSNLMHGGFFGPVSSSGSAAAIPVRSGMVGHAKPAPAPFCWEEDKPQPSVPCWGKMSK